MFVVVFEPDEFYGIEVEDGTTHVTIRRPDGKFRRCFVECHVNLTGHYMVYIVRNREVSEGEIYEAAKLFGGGIVSRSVRFEPPAE